MIAEQNHGAHSAQVEMRLIINGSDICITHMGGDFIFVETPAEHPPCEAFILLIVDESETRWKVKLPEGMTSASKRVALALSE